jgi:hypothetical protein
MEGKISYTAGLAVVVLTGISSSSSMALQPFVEPWSLFQFLNLIHGRTLWTGD